MIKTTENEVTSAIIDGLNVRGYKVYKTFAGTAPIFHKSQMVFRRQKPGLQTKGMSDLIAIGHGKLLFIEVKSSTGKASPEQIEFLKSLESIKVVKGTVANCWEDVTKLTHSK
mgnify:CR=1 FL=1